MGRVLAIDYGTKRVGFAVTDPLQIIASPLETVPTHQVIQFLKTYFASENVDCVVLGFPTNLNNKDTDMTADVRAFHKRLEKEFPNKAIHLHDEKFTSKMALDAMITGGMKKKDRKVKGNVDRISAAIILQSYLESNSK